MAGDSPGIIRAADISGSLDAKNIVMDVLKEAIELTDLAPICAKVSVPELTATVPIMTIEAGMEDLEEWEEREIEGSEFAHVDFDLKKDRIKIGRSDEANYKSKKGDPLTLQKSAGALRLAQILNKKIIAALNTTPQTDAGGDWTGTSTNPLTDIGTAVAKIRPYKADFIIMSQDVWKAFIANSKVATYVQGNPTALKGAMTRIPGYELDVYVSKEIDDLGSGADGTEAAFVGCSKAPAAVIGQGPVKVRTDDVLSGGVVYQIDVWRQVKSTLLTTSGSLNMACHKLTDLLT